MYITFILLFYLSLLRFKFRKIMQDELNETHDDYFLLRWLRGKLKNQTSIYAIYIYTIWYAMFSL